MPPKKQEKPKLIIYRIRVDQNVAPHVANGILTLTICKPKIRIGANVGDYVLALVADTNEEMKALKKIYKADTKYFLAAYLFRVDDIVTMQGYESWCHTHNESRICTNDSFFGDCQYFGPELEWKKGPHPPSERNRNISGRNALISRHYAAWTSSSPHLLTPEERAELQMDDEQVKKIGVGQTYLRFEDVASMARSLTMADSLINSTKVVAPAVEPENEMAALERAFHGNKAVAPAVEPENEMAALERAFHGNKGGRRTRKRKLNVMTLF